MITLLPFLAVIPAASGLLISFLYLLLVLVLVGALFWAIDYFFGPFPQPVRVIMGIVLLIAVLIWAIHILGGV